MTPKFVISMLALDGLEMSKKCIDSILASNRQDFLLFLTNNGSSDGTKEYFDSLSDSRIRVIHHQENMGFIEPNNRAFAIARDFSAEFFITVNNDLTVPPNWLDVFSDLFASNPRLAVSGPKGTLSRVDHTMSGNSSDRYEYAEGSCMCVRMAFLDPHEPLFSRYLKFIYFDDLDLSLRMQRQGYEVKQANFHVAHRNGSTCSRHPDAISKCREAMRNNQAVMLKKWAHWNKVRLFNFPILFRRTFASGDALLMTPIIRAMKKKWPLCPIDVETGSPDIFKGNPHIRKAARQIMILRETWVIDLNGCYEKHPSRHVLENYAEAASLEMNEIESRCELYGYKEYQKVDAPNRLCAVHIGPTTWPGRNWPMDRWRSVINALSRNGWKVVLFGDKSRDAYEVHDDQRGQAGVKQMAGMISQCELFVGLDSFPMHVAQTVGVPTVALFGINNPDCFMTKGNSGSIAVRSDPAHPNTGRRNKIPNVTFINSDDSVMRTITVDMVLEAVNKLSEKVAAV